MPKPTLSREQAYELALNRKIGGIMPSNLYEQSIRTKPRKRRGRKNARITYLKLPRL